jgi:hypothetical protein
MKRQKRIDFLEVYPDIMSKELRLIEFLKESSEALNAFLVFSEES